CKQVHGHGSCKFSVKIEGWQDDKWVVDFGVVKRIVKEVVEEIDHKFLVSNEYVKVKDTSCIIKYETVNGKHYLELPLSEVKIVNFDPTLENILRWMSSKIMDRLPLNVEKITLVAQEGMGGTAEFTLERKVKNEI
ncbi:MAG: 6-carboxytetrahydropterin synthase, partial [Candidatus Micrarchaeia archaeon]